MLSNTLQMCHHHARHWSVSHKLPSGLSFLNFMYNLKPVHLAKNIFLHHVWSKILSERLINLPVWCMDITLRSAASACYSNTGRLSCNINFSRGTSDRGVKTLMASVRLGLILIIITQETLTSVKLVSLNHWIIIKKISERWQISI